LFVNSKWKIIELITNEPKTPQELSKELKTSLANISQQLRFLEFAGLTTKTKIQKESFGKPNNKISITNNFTYLVNVSNNLTKKELILTDDFQELMIICWLKLNEYKDNFENFIIDNKKQLVNIKKIIFARSPKEFYVLTNTPKRLVKKYGDLNFIFVNKLNENSELEVIFKR